MSLYATAEITSLIQTTNCLMKGIRSPNSPFQICINCCFNLSEEIRLMRMPELVSIIYSDTLQSWLWYPCCIVLKNISHPVILEYTLNISMRSGYGFPVSMQASDDAESVGNCPFCQRLFMILWLKGINFTLTTVDMRRAPDVLKDLAPGSQPPFLIYNDEVKTDTNKIEEFLEEKLAPPNYPKLGCRYKESNTSGQDIFRKFSAYIKNPNPGLNSMLEKQFLSTLVKLSMYLDTPLTHELDQNPNIAESTRLYLDGDSFTLADCNLLPKLNIIKVVCKEYRNFDIPRELKGLTRYLDNAYKQEQFRYTCPNDSEILIAYKSVAKYLTK
uniref:Chloride intracellular channel protein 3 n=1 Tax=Poecilia reticulata TaxID=8081 RepID=A0A3P9NPQ3_POERE